MEYEPSVKSNLRPIRKWLGRITNPKVTLIIPYCVYCFSTGKKQGLPSYYGWKCHILRKTLMTSMVNEPTWKFKDKDIFYINIIFQVLTI